MKTRTTGLHIRLAPEEKELFQELAKKQGITITKLLVNLVRKESEK